MVSILVLVDFALKHRIIQVRIQGKDIVSILVLVDFALKLMLNHGYHFPIILFQSLFWWILLLNFARAEAEKLLTPVSILVLVDFALKPISVLPTRISITRVSILVLVDFALKPKIFLVSLLRRLGFNPCFGGFCS